MRTLFLLYLALLSITTSAETDDWIGFDAPAGGHVGFHFGLYEGGAKNIALAGTFPSFFFSEFHVSYSDYRNTEGDDKLESQNYSIAWNSDPYQTFSFGAGFETRGRSSNLETNEVTLALNVLVSEKNQVIVKGIMGEANVDIDGFPSQIEQEFNCLGLGEIDRQGLALTYSHQSDSWGVRLFASAYDNDEASSASDEELEVFENNIERRSRSEAEFVALLIYSSFLNYCQGLGLNDSASRLCAVSLYQSQQDEIEAGIDRWINDSVQFYRAQGPKSALSNHELGMDAYFYRGAHTFNLGFLGYESYISEEFSTQYYATHAYQIDSNASLGYLLSYSDDSSTWYGEIFVGFDW